MGSLKKLIEDDVKEIKDMKLEDINLYDLYISIRLGQFNIEEQFYIYKNGIYRSF